MPGEECFLDRSRALRWYYQQPTQSAAPFKLIRNFLFVIAN